MSIKYNKMVDDENKNEECVICFGCCNDEIFYFCNICRRKFHTKCLNSWIKQCKDKGRKAINCCYCQNKNTMRKIKKCFCSYYSVSVN